MTAATYAKSTAEILRAIACPRLSLHRGVGHGYWYFIYDDLDAGGIYDSKSVYVPRLNDMTVAQWAEIGVAFAKECGGTLR